MINITVSTAGSVGIISMNGRFDFDAHRAFKKAYDPLLQKVVSSIEINLSGVEYMDSAALGMLLLLHERSAVAGKTVTLARPNNNTLQQILDIANFKKIFTIR